MNKKLLTMGLAALLMAGCSSDDVVGGEGDKGGASAVKGYVGITIALPSTSASRAVEYEEGTPEEYAVNDVTLLFFSGDALKQVTQFKAGDFTWTPATDNGDGITTETVLPVVPLKDKTATNVLAIVNNNNSLLQVSSSTFDGNGLIANAGSLKDKNNVDITDKATLLKAIEGTNVTAFTSNGYFMSSAAISTSTDATDKLFTVVVPKESKQEAMDNAKNTVIYVERIVGKATVKHATGTDWTSDWTYVIDNATSAFNDDQIEFKGWALDLTNTKTYPFHKVSTETAKDNGFDKWTAVDFAGNQNRYMWAIDPNYSADVAADLAVTNVADVDKALNKPLYCLENTFNLHFMKQPQTTRLLLKAKYTPNAAHVMGDDTKGSVTSLGWFRLGESTQAYTLQGIEAELLAKAKVIHSEATAVTVSNLKVGKAAFSKTGDNQISVTGGTWNDDDLDKLINMAGKLTFFQEGFCYYPVLIKHFAQTWSGQNYLVDANPNNNDFLGRYGIVRNNWYEITINKVSAPGEPVYPTVPDLADDVTNYYIQATVKILDWAKRNQSVDL